MKTRILVVEDERWMRVELKNFLENKMYDVVLADGYKNGLKLGCAKKKPSPSRNYRSGVANESTG